MEDMIKKIFIINKQQEGKTFEETRDLFIVEYGAEQGAGFVMMAYELYKSVEIKKLITISDGLLRIGVQHSSSRKQIIMSLRTGIYGAKIDDMHTWICPEEHSLISAMYLFRSGGKNYRENEGFKMLEDTLEKVVQDINIREMQ